MLLQPYYPFEIITTGAHYQRESTFCPQQESLILWGFSLPFILTPMNDQDKISPWEINAILTRQVMRAL